MPPAKPPQGTASTPGGCPGTTKAGTPCRAPVQPESGFCLFHDPSRQGELAGIRAKGATTKNKLVALQGKRDRLDTVPALVAFTGRVIQDTLSGDVAPELARACLYGVAIQRQLLEASDLEARLRRLEEAQATTPKGTHRWGR